MKKLLCLLLAGLLLALPAAGESTAALVPIYLEDSVLLADTSGQEIVPFGEYSAIIPLNGADETGEALFAAGVEKDGAQRFALMDGTGALRTEPLYDVLSLQDGILLCTRDGLSGMLGLDGEVLLPTQYTALVPNGEGGLLALKTDCWDDQPDGVYAIDTQGRESATGVKTLFLFDSAFSEGRMPLLSAENGRYGYVDARGQWAVRPQFAYAMDYANGKAIASISSGYGVVDEAGNWVLTPRYSLIWRCRDAFVATEGSSACVVFDAETLTERFRVTGSNLYAYDDGDYIVMVDDDASYLYDLEGRLLFTASAQATINTSPGGLIIVDDGPWGSERTQLYTAEGEPLGEPRQGIYSLGLVNGVDYFGYLTMEAEPGNDGSDYWDYDPYSMRYGLMDAAGNACTEAEYTELQPAGGQCFTAETLDAAGLIDTGGEWIAKWPKEPE